MSAVLTRTTHAYQPRGACRDALLARGPEVLVSGPAGTGKSRALLEKIHFMAMLNPNSRFLMVRKTQSSLQSSALVTWRKFVINEALLSGDVAYYGGSAREPGFYYKNGSIVVTGGMDKASKVMSTEYDVIYVQEAVELLEDDWEALLSRLRNGAISFQQIIADTNPAEPTHWLNQRCSAGKTRMLNSKHTDNPVLYQDGVLTLRGREYLDKLESLTGVRRQRLLEGRWSAAEGIIYEGFSPAIHLIDPFEIPADWQRIWSVDFGFTNPFVCQWWAIDHDGRIYLYRELYRTKRTVSAMAQRILAQVTDEKGVWIEPKPRKLVCDHDAEGRAQLESFLFSTTAAHKKVSVGIGAVQDRMKVQGDGKPRIFIMRNCRVEKDLSLEDRKLPTCTEDELPGYVWNEDKDAPVKENDHGMDAMRYVVAEQDLKPHGVPFRSFK
jgi:PBSX family phage terminase large subunit